MRKFYVQQDRKKTSHLSQPFLHVVLRTHLVIGVAYNEIRRYYLYTQPVVAVADPGFLFRGVSDIRDIAFTLAVESLSRKVNC